MDYIFNKTSWEPGFDNRPARLYLSQTILKVSKDHFLIISDHPGPCVRATRTVHVLDRRVHCGRGHAGGCHQQDLWAADDRGGEVLVRFTPTLEVSQGTWQRKFGLGSFLAGTVWAFGDDWLWVWANHHLHRPASFSTMGWAFYSKEHLIKEIFDPHYEKLKYENGLA